MFPTMSPIWHNPQKKKRNNAKLQSYQYYLFVIGVRRRAPIPFGTRRTGTSAWHRKVHNSTVLNATWHNMLRTTHLVVLSACETGLGKVKEGEGVYDLRRAFQMAGARTVISTLWPVSDEATSATMGRLYYGTDVSLPETIRGIQLERIHELRAQGNADHPFSWAAFIVLLDRRQGWVSGLRLFDSHFPL